MDAVFDGGGAWRETPFGFACRPDQQEERMQEALEFVSAATAHLRRRLRAMELKMESAHDASLAAAGALGRQVARVERLEGKMAAVERRSEAPPGAASSNGCGEYPACPGCRASSSASSVFSASSSSSSCFDVDDVVLSQASLLDPNAQVEENVSPARDVLTRCLCGLRLDSASLSSKAAVDVPVPKAFSFDSSAATAPKVSKKQMPSVRSSFSCRLCDHLLDASSCSPSSDVAFPNQEAPRLDSTIHTAPIVSDKNVTPPRNSLIDRLRELFLDSSSELSPTAVETSIRKASRSDNSAQTACSVSEKLLYSSHTSSSRRRPCGVLRDSSKVSTAAAACPNQRTSRLDANIQPGSTVSVKHVDSARSTLSRRLGGPNSDCTPVSITAGSIFPNQEAFPLDSTAQTTPVFSDDHSSPESSILLRRLYGRILDSLSELDATNDAFPNQESLRLDCTAQTASTVSDDTPKRPAATRRFCRQMFDSLGSSAAAPCISSPTYSRLDANAKMAGTSDNRISSTSPFSQEISSHFPDSSPRSGAAASSAISKAANSNGVAEIPCRKSDNHLSPVETSLSSGLYKVLRSAAAFAGHASAFPLEPISRFTPSSDSRADTSEQLRQSSEKSPPPSPPRDVAFKSTACGSSEPLSATMQAAACTQTDGSGVVGNSEHSTQASQCRMLYTSGYVTSEIENFPMSESMSRHCSSMECHCPSTAGAHKSLSGSYTPGRVSQSTSCATFSNTNIASSSGFCDWEDNSQLSSISGCDEPSQSTSFYPVSERITQRLVWVSPPCNPPLYYCVPVVNSSLYRVYCREDPADKNTVTSGSPWSAFKPQSCFPSCDVVPPVPSATNETKSSFGSIGLSGTLHSFQTTPVTPPSDVNNCGTTCNSKLVSALTQTERSAFIPDDSIFSGPNYSPFATNAASISGDRQTVNHTSACLISPSKSPSCSRSLARVCHADANRRSVSLVRKSESSWSLLSSSSASRPTSCGVSAEVTPSSSSSFGSSQHSSESKLHSTSTPTPATSQSTSRAHITQLSKQVSSSATSASRNMQESTYDEQSICSPDVSLSISQPTTQTSSHDSFVHTIHYISLVSGNRSSTVHNTPRVTMHQSASIPFDDDTTASKCSVRSSCPLDNVTIRRPLSSPETSALIARVSSALESRSMKSHVISRSSSPQIPPAPPPTPLNDVPRSEEVNCSCVTVAKTTISRTAISISSRAATIPSTCSTTQPPSDEIFTEVSKHMTSDVRQFSSKTVILPKDINRPNIPHVDSPTFRPRSGCVSLKDDNTPVSGHPVHKSISETTFVVDSPNAANHPGVTPSPGQTHRPNSSSNSKGHARPPQLGVRKLISEATFVLESPKRIVRPTVSCDDSKLIRRSANLDLAATSRGAFAKARCKPRCVVSLMDLPSCARGDLPAAGAATAVLGANPPPPPPARPARSRSAEVKLGRRLLKAAQEGRAPAVRKLLDEGADVNFTFATKWTALHRAVKMGHEDVVSVLLDGGANVEARTSYDFTALHIAAYYDHKGLCLARLLGAGSNLASRNRSGKTPLHYAAEMGNKMAVRALMVAGANTTSLDDDGKTPYDVAKVDDVRGLLAPASGRQKGVVRAG